jgi:hypothetical protein
MSKWTNWKKIAKSNECYLDDVIYTGASCYELGVKQWLIEDIQPVYVAETSNEKRRISCYATHGSHLNNIINEHLKMGHALYYRTKAKRPKKEAKKMQDFLLAKYEYDWNIQFNWE